MKNDKIKVVSLFSGIGGFEQGIIKALGRENVEVVFSSEIDKFAKKSYQYIHKVKVSGDITKIKASEIPNHDLLVGGFPCQAFSIAGKRQGFSDTRGTLFFEIARILKEKKPKHFILENVKGLINHDEGKTFDVIKDTLEKLNYTFTYQVLNSKHFNLPQNRERIFIVGEYNNPDFDYAFPENNTVDVILEDILEKKVDEKFYLSEEMQKRFIPKETDNDIKLAGYIDNKYKDKDQQRVMKTNGIGICLTVSGGNQKKIIIPIKENTKKGYKEADPFDSVNLAFINQNKMRGRVGKKISNTLTTSPNMGTITNDFRIRKLTPLECFRCQGFPDSWYYLLKKKKISNTQLYKMAGNAVSVNVIEALVKNLYK